MSHGRRQKKMLQAIGNKVIVKPVEKKYRTEGGIELPPDSVGTDPIGEVVSIGELVKGIEVGQKVLYVKWEHIEIKHDNVMYYVFDYEKHIKAIIDYEEETDEPTK